MFPQSRSTKPVSQSVLSALLRPRFGSGDRLKSTSDVRRTSVEHYKRIGYSGKVATVNRKYEENAGCSCF